MVMLKICYRCAEAKPIDRFGKNKHHKDGISRYCKDCRNEYSRKNDSKNVELVRARRKRWVDNNPEKVKDITERGRESARIRMAELAKNNPERKKEINDRYREKNYIKLKEKKRIKYQEKKEIFAAYRKKHSEERKLYEWNRRARIHNSIDGNPITKEEWENLKNEYDGRCAYCNKKSKLTLDHIIPISGGGKHNIENAIPSCQSCNSKKNNKPLLIFMYDTNIRGVAS